MKLRLGSCPRFRLQIYIEAGPCVISDDVAHFFNNCLRMRRDVVLISQLIGENSISGHERGGGIGVLRRVSS